MSFHWRRYSQRRGQADDIRLVEVHCCQHTATKFLFLVVLVCVGVRVRCDVGCWFLVLMCLCAEKEARGACMCMLWGELLKPFKPLLLVG